MLGISLPHLPGIFVAALTILRKKYMQMIGEQNQTSIQTSIALGTLEDYEATLHTNRNTDNLPVSCTVLIGASSRLINIFKQASIIKSICCNP